MQKFMPSSAILGVLSVAFLHCGGGATPEPESPEPTGMSSQAAEEAPVPPPEPEATPAAEAAPEAAPPKREPLTDEQILAVTQAANSAEIDLAKLAQKKAKNARVKKFAGMMVADHNSAKGKQTKIAAKAKLTPGEHSLATQFKDDASSAMESLKTATGPDFDKAYIDGQVEMHRKVLDAIDTQLLPDAQNEELKKLLEEIRPKIEAHLKEAQDIQTVLAAAPAEDATPAKGGAAAAPKK